jgi:F-type H+-transporting ATPase subunit delta
MAEIRTTARPYAEAVFELARARGQYARWSEALGALEAVVRDPQVSALARDPRLERARLAGLLLDVLGGHLDEEGRNFVRLLVDYRRLALVPEIRELYDAMRADAEGRVEVDVRTAYPLEGRQREMLIEALKRRFGREVNLAVAVDPLLIGGIEIRAGDLVIDGSVRGRLAALAAQLSE